MMYQCESVGNHADDCSAWNIVCFLMSINPMGFANCLHRWAIADIQKRMRERFTSIGFQWRLNCRSISKPEPKSRSSAAREILDQASRLTKIGFEAPMALVVAMGVFAGQRLYSKAKECWKGESAHRLPALPSRPDLRKIRRIHAIDNLDAVLERFFINELEYSHYWTTAFLVPLARHFLLASTLPKRTRSNLPLPNLSLSADPASTTLPYTVLLAEAARLSPRRHLWLYLLWNRQRFYIRVHQTFGSNDSILQPPEMELLAIENSSLAEEIESDDEIVDTDPMEIEHSSEIAPNTEPTADNVEITAADIPISTGSVETSPNVAKFRSIFSETEISRYVDGSVVVCKTAIEKELFPVLQDLKLLFEPRVENDTVLESIALLFIEKRRGLGRRLRDQWKQLKKGVTAAGVQVQFEGKIRARLQKSWIRVKSVFVK